MSTVQSPEQAQAEWLDRLNRLMDDVKKWAEELDWSTRRIDVPMEESQTGKYRAPALLLQQQALKMLLEPIGSSTPGSQGRVDLYVMPLYDDIATFLYCDGEWHLYYLFSDAPDAYKAEPEALPFTKQTFKEVLENLKKHAG